jgi:periplasmic protein CpxP/Spy
MNRIVLSAALTLSLTATLAVAQTATPPDSSSGPASKGHYGHHHQPDPQKQAAFLAKRLNLTSDQQSKLEPILADRDQKIAALRSDTSLTPDQKMEQFHAIHQNMKQQLSSILTPEQMEQLKSFRGHRGGHHQGQPQTPPPSGL